MSDSSLDDALRTIRVSAGSEDTWQEVCAMVRDTLESGILRSSEIWIGTSGYQDVDERLAIVADGSAQGREDAVFLRVGISAVLEENLHNLDGVGRSCKLEDAWSATEICASFEEELEYLEMVDTGPEHVFRTG